MEKIEKRLTDLSGALAHNYPEIKLTRSCKPDIIRRDAEEMPSLPGKKWE